MERLIYLDHAATSYPKPQSVSRAMEDALRTKGGNPGRSGHTLSLRAARAVYECREKVCSLFHFDKPENVIFTQNTTYALNMAIKGVVRSGDHVVTSNLEHNSVLRPLYRLQKNGVQLDFVEADARGVLRYEQFEQKLRPNTRAVVVSHASNVTGNVADLAFVADFTQKHGLLLVLDAAQTAGIRPLDVKTLGADVLCFTGHKGLLGPQGTGGAYVRPGLRVAPLVVGGSGVHSFAEEHPAQMPTALEAGTLNVPGIAGLGAGVRWILQQGVQTLQAKETARAQLFYEQLQAVENLTFYGDFSGNAPRVPIVSLNIGDEDSAWVADALWEDAGICVRAGAHCAPLMHKALGTAAQGVVRFSFSHANTEEEVLRAAKAVRTLAREV